MRTREESEREGDGGGNVGLRCDEFAEIHPGRRLTFVYPFPVEHDCCKEITVVVLDSESHCRKNCDPQQECVALLVPQGKEEEWIFCSEGGQWQLVASAGVSRFILLWRNWSRGAKEIVGDGGRCRTGRRCRELGMETVCNERNSEAPGTRFVRFREEFGSRGRKGSQARTREGVISRYGDSSWEKVESEPDRLSGTFVERHYESKEQLCSRRESYFSRTSRCATTIEGREGEGSGARGTEMEWTLENRKDRKCESKDIKRIKKRVCGRVADCIAYDDEEVRGIFSHLIVALAPKNSFRHGVPFIRFVTYSDNVVRRITLEVAFSPLTGLMAVEDVELNESADELHGRCFSGAFCSTSALSFPAPDSKSADRDDERVRGEGHIFDGPLVGLKSNRYSFTSRERKQIQRDDICFEIASHTVDPKLALRSDVDTHGVPVSVSSRTWRRRLVFKRMPNLIQTEASLAIHPAGDKKKRKAARRSGVTKHDTKDRSMVERIAADRFQFESQTTEHTGEHCESNLLGFLRQRRTMHSVDHSKLVHKYLAPIVAGLVLVAPCLEAHDTTDSRAKILSIGVGGGALPMFLREHFRFSIQAVELDEVVLDLAKRHFGLVEDQHLQLILGDGVAVVQKIAAIVRKEGYLIDPLQGGWKSSASELGSTALDSFPVHVPYSSWKQPMFVDCEEPYLEGGKEQQRSKISTSQLNNVCGSKETENQSCKIIGSCTSDCPSAIHKDCQRALQSSNYSVRQEISDQKSNVFERVHFASKTQPGDPRVEVIIVDIDVGDARASLSAPPMAFVEESFLIAARLSLRPGGMLAMNVVPCGNVAYRYVIDSLMAVFAEVYEIELKNDVNHVVFALPFPCGGVQIDGLLVDQLKYLVSEPLIASLHKVCSSAKSRYEQDGGMC